MPAVVSSKQVQELIMTSTINDFFTFLEGYFLNINCLLTRWCLDWERQQCGTLFKLAFDEKDVISELLHLPVNEKRKSQDSGNNISKGETYYFFCPPKDSNQERGFSNGFIAFNKLVRKKLSKHECLVMETVS